MHRKGGSRTAPTTWGQLPASQCDCPLLTAHCPLPTAHCLLPTAYFSEALLGGEGDGLGAVAGVQLTHDAADVELGGPLADGEFGGDLFIGQPARHQA